MRDEAIQGTESARPVIARSALRDEAIQGREAGIPFASTPHEVADGVILVQAAWAPTRPGRYERLLDGFAARRATRHDGWGFAP